MQKVIVRGLVLRCGLGVMLLVAGVVVVVAFPQLRGGCRPPASVAASPQAGPQGAGDPYFPSAGNPGYDVTDYDIQIRYEPVTDRLQGHTTITAKATAELTRVNLDLKLSASAVTVNDRPAAIRQNAGKLEVTPAAVVRAGSPMTLRVDYAGVPSAIPDKPCGTSPWLRTPDGAVAIGEPDIAAWWYPSNDHPSDKARFTITAVVPVSLQVISNGSPLGDPEPADPGWQQWRWRHSEPMATYLAFVAIGHYDIVRRDTPFGPYLAAYDRGLPPQVAVNARASVEQTPQIIADLSEILGPYPFHELGGVVPNAPTLSSSLENQTRPVYLSKQFATGEHVTGVVHELAHQWFGDNVAVQRWSDIWLSEGLATYTQWLYSEHTGGNTTREAAARFYARHPADDAFWQILPGDPGAEQMFSQTVHDRGAMALQALRAAVGDEDFFTALRTWSAARRGGNGSVTDFLALIQQVSGKNVDTIARTWLFTPGRPPAPPA